VFCEKSYLHSPFEMMEFVGDEMVEKKVVEIIKRQVGGFA
jgi:hypothetical protein